ncbi:caspase family protein [Bacillus velezensis]|uniref:caspase family protein n=1 Tax=Bacillus velezensis TaxID=492670 RepID=UPI002452DE3C|nr:caspase family protein [Bacillus velezensis]MDH3122570.1 caspase family protein [Bacillus velezensis]
MKKLGLITGINYHNTSYELGGCLNDAAKILEKLIKEFDFQSKDIQLLLEEVATRKNIIDGLERLVKELEAGDIGVFSYSGHGTVTADLPPIEEEDMLDEAIVPIDSLNDRSLLIRDDEINEILSRIKEGVHLFLIFDSCHSGTIYRLLPDADNGEKMIKKMIPPSDSVRKIQSVVNEVIEEPLISKSHPLAGSNYILLAGCKEDELSYDDGQNGYLTREIVKYMEKGITYQELYTKVRDAVYIRSGKKQEPQIFGELITKKILE